MNGEVIKQFLVSLGFGVDESSLKKFTKALGDASLKVTALYASIKLMAAGAFYSISKVAEGFEEIGYQYRIIAPAVNKALILRREMFRAWAAAGLNVREAVVNAVKFNMALTKLQYTLKAIAQSVSAKFFPLLTKQMDQFRKQLYANMPKIQATLERFIKFIFKAFEATVTLGTRIWSILGRVYDFFAKLHEATNGWSTVLVGVIAAWKLLNLEFLATPLGMILTGLIAIAALFDDFKTWQEGGESLFDWSSFVPVIDTVTTSLKALWSVLDAILNLVSSIAATAILVFKGEWSAAIASLKNQFTSLFDVVKKFWDYVKTAGGAASSIMGWLGGAGDWDVSKALMGNAAANASSIGQPNPVSRPIGTNNIANANTNQTVSQQTYISVSGAADANSTARAVTSQQYNVNRDMVRNLKGATTPAPVTK